MRKYKNPILCGFNPDPSICRVGEDFYLVTSSFEFFPGVPLYHSRNLSDWTQVGFCLDSEKKLNLQNCKASGGIYAPVIRYHEGTFFMTTTNVSDKGNLIVYTTDPKDGWSDPQWVDQGGIDPSLFFDEDGKVYYTTTGNLEDGTSMIQMCEIDPFTGTKLSSSRVINFGCNDKYPEGPHIYKKDGSYYLLLAEGGTEYGHMVTIQRANTPWGPYEPCPHNPILTHRDDSRGEICCTGHGDLIEDQNGNWWMVCLGVRQIQGEYGNLMLHHLGRESFLAPVLWTEDGWPIVGENGKISLCMEGELPGEGAADLNQKMIFRDDFSTENFDLAYNFLRNPDLSRYIRDTEQKCLILRGTVLH